MGNRRPKRYTKGEGTKENVRLVQVDGYGTVENGLRLTLQTPFRARVKVGDHMALTQDADLASIVDKEITMTPLRVLGYIRAHVGFENIIYVSQKDVAEFLEIGKSAVSQAFSLLMRKGFIERLPGSSLKCAYRLNPQYGWRGSYENWDKALNGSGPLNIPCVNGSSMKNGKGDD